MRTSYLIPTFRRPEPLRLCLESVIKQLDFDPAQDEVIVVDNCPEGSAKAICEGFANVRYERETEPGVAAVRNRAFRAAKGASLVLIDDDQEADSALTQKLRAALHAHGGDLAFAAIEAILEGETEGPREPWERLFARSWPDAEGVLEDGRIHSLSTGGVMIRSGAVAEVFAVSAPFDRALGQTGGEDIAFFRALHKANKRFLWVPSARIHERVPVARLTRSFLLERRFSSGQLRTLLEGTEHPARALGFMAMGIAQATLGMTRFVIAKAIAPSEAVAHEADIVAGAGKVFFFGPFRKKRYGKKQPA
jgi:succinoglycan biosynthesis protein ExoM